ncbi:uncharacterized protein LOC115966817 [Quercus lobata]|uniref:uncharacterized protein LOC115966817 n=1 Tax=Quercus lobata TaxID=97700 RepID=UPI0012459434|nr:uncharacterized protein LOC115966817 [Quercus lobata]
MGFTIAQGLMLVLLIASTIAVSLALPYGNCNDTHTSNKIMVGDHHNWIYGFNYTKWAFKHGPFYLYDTLVFNYDPSTPNTFPHNVYLLPNYESFIKCDFTNA